MPSIFNHRYDPRPEIHRSGDFGAWLGRKFSGIILWAAHHTLVVAALAIIGGGMLIYGFFHGATTRK